MEPEAKEAEILDILQNENLCETQQKNFLSKRKTNCKRNKT
jgi:hypothetical protein